MIERKEIEYRNLYRKNRGPSIKLEDSRPRERGDGDTIPWRWFQRFQSIVIAKFLNPAEVHNTSGNLRFLRAVESVD